MSPKYKLTDQELIVLLKTGDHVAFEEIYKRYWMIMYTHALKMLKSEDDARDVVQEVYTNLWLKSQSLHDDVNLGGYLFISTKNKVLDVIARERVRIDYTKSLIAFAELHNNTILDPIEEKELMQALKREIEQLPAKMRQIFEMRVNKNSTYKEIAEELNISDKTVKKQISNAIKIIRPKLQHFSIVILLFAKL
jgi:RNA polymerase sigma-70 factor (family 1)